MSASRVHTDPKKIESVSKIATPQSVAQVSSFLGLALDTGHRVSNVALDRKMILQTDASDVGLCAVLTQCDENGNERVI